MPPKRRVSGNRRSHRLSKYGSTRDPNKQSLDGPDRKRPKIGSETKQDDTEIEPNSQSKSDSDTPISDTSGTDSGQTQTVQHIMPPKSRVSGNRRSHRQSKNGSTRDPNDKSLDGPDFKRPKIGSETKQDDTEIGPNSQSKSDSDTSNPISNPFWTDSGETQTDANLTKTSDRKQQEMERVWNTCKSNPLTTCRVQLIEDLETNTVLDYIEQEKIFPPLVLNSIKGTNCVTEKNRKIVDGLKNRDYDAYLKFKKCLKNSTQMQLVTALEKEEEKLRSTMKDAEVTSPLLNPNNGISDASTSLVMEKTEKDVRSPPLKSTSLVLEKTEKDVHSPPLASTSLVLEKTEGVRSPPLASTSVVLEKAENDVRSPPSASTSLVLERTEKDVLAPPSASTSLVLEKSEEDVRAPPSASTSLMLGKSDDVRAPPSNKNCLETKGCLRGYQRELVEKVKNENAIVCEGTGTGKTRVALEIIRQHLKSVHGKGKVAFMVINNLLVEQQEKESKEYLPELQDRTKIISDDISMMIGAFLPENDILFFTPQILVNNLDNKSVESLGKFTLLVFDECHHTKGDSPYNNLMRRYLFEKKEGHKLPQIIGLTASLEVGNSYTPLEACDSILRVCARMDVKRLPTVERCKQELEEYTATPKDKTLRFQERDPDPCKDILLSAIEYIEQEILREKAYRLPQCYTLITSKRPKNKESMEYNQWTLNVVEAAESNQTSSDPEIKRDIKTCAEYLNTFSAALEVNRLLETDDVVRILVERHQRDFANINKLSATDEKLLNKLKDILDQIHEKCISVENPNILTMSKMLRDVMQQKDSDLRAMVFVKTRATCKSLANKLEIQLGKVVRVKPLYGKGTSGKEEGMDEDEQREIVKGFDEGYYNVLVATAIGTEGIDIKECNIAVRYDYTENEVRTVQLKGRIRKQDGSIITIGSKKTIDKEKINVYKLDLMQQGLELARSLRPEQIEARIKVHQQDEMRKYKESIARLRASKERQRANVDFALKCKICDTFACNVSDVRKHGQHHIVPDKSFAEKIEERQPKGKSKGCDGFRIKFELGCKKCKNDWGFAADIYGKLCYTLHIIKFNFYNVNSNEGPRKYKQWARVEYEVPDITEDEKKKLQPSN